MSFSWKALFFSPLAVPFVASVALALLAPSMNPLLSFLIWFGLSSAISIGVSVLMLIPTLFLISRFRPLTARITAAVGALLGGLVYMPIVWQSYLASGDNSGPPNESFAHYLWQHFFGLELLAFLIGGLITALVYWLLATDTAKPS